MQTFKDFLAEDAALEKELENEALDIRARMKAKANLRKNKAKIAMGRRKAARRIADPARLKKRADRQARKAVLAKILKSVQKSDLSYGARAAAEKRLETKKALIKRLARKLLPKVRKADREKFSQRQQSQQAQQKQAQSGVEQ